jgi:simple sugar transport system permease protein
VTLAGMFVARGLCYLIDTESIPVRDPVFVALAEARIPLGDSSLSSGAAVALFMVVVALWLAHATRFGRTVYAIGGNARSATLMGLPVGATLMRVYAMSGFCAALAGLTMTVYMLSGYSLHAVGLELDAIAAVVIGGTLLTGGVGYVAGTVVGVLILGVIQTLVIFNGTLSSWWTRIVVGILLFLFCVAQRLIEGSAKKSQEARR